MESVARRAMGPSRGKYSRSLAPGAARSAIWVNDSPGVLCAALAAALREACKCNVCEYSKTKFSKTKFKLYFST